MAKKHQQSEEEKEYHRRHKNWDKVTQDINEKTAELNRVLSEQFTPIMNQLDAMQRPMFKKDVRINGHDIFVSMLKDGRVIFNFATADDAKPFFDAIEDGFWRTIWKKIRRK